MKPCIKCGASDRYKSGRCKACKKAYCKANLAYIVNRNKWYHRARYYQLSKAQYDSLLIKQGNACAICRAIDFGKLGPVIDHCHATKRVRGILCDICNRGLGYYKDSEELLLSAARYIREN